MCMSRLHRVVTCEGTEQAAVVDAAGRPGLVSLLALEGPPPRPGEWLVVHSGYAIDRLEQEEALRVLAELKALEAGEEGSS